LRREINLKKGLILCAIIACFFAVASTALADTIIDFQAVRGIISYDGLNGPLVGSSIPIVVVSGINTRRMLVSSRTSGLLNFTTGTWYPSGGARLMFGPGGTDPSQ